MFTFSTTEDYIVDTEDIKESQKLIKMIWEHKQNTQKDLLVQHNIDYSIDVIEYVAEEEQKMTDIPAVDCDQCLQPTWADDLYDGLCPTCGVNDLESFFK